MNSVSVGVLIDRLNTGGVEKIAIEQVISLRKIGVDARLVVLRRRGVDNSAFKDLRRNIPIIFLDDRLPGLLKVSFAFPYFNFFSFFHIAYPFFIPFVIRATEFNYIVVHGTYTAFTAIMIKKVRKIPFSTFVWDPIYYILTKVYAKKIPFYSILLSLAKYIDTIIASSSDYVLVGGKAHNKYLRECRARIKVIYPSVEPIKINNPKKKEYFISATAWKDGKNPEYLIELLKFNPKYKFKVVGKWIEKSYQVNFSKLVKQLNLASSIEIVGEVSEKELSRYYKEALAAIQVNDDRGFGMLALEAAANGTTFIIPEKQGVCELFTNGKEGFFTKEKETKVIVNHLNKLLDKDFSISMGEQAWKKVKANYSWEAHARMVMKVVLEKAKVIV